MNILELHFDFYTCNVLIARLINIVRGVPEPLKILDVGGKGGHLRDFLVQDELHILDILPPVDGDDRSVNYLCGTS